MMNWAAIQPIYVCLKNLANKLWRLGFTTLLMKCNYELLNMQLQTPHEDFSFLRQKARYIDHLSLVIRVDFIT